jgi:nitrite reductase/ring-hydroxylating ferredoxin subunit
MNRYVHGWFQLAFENEVREELTPLRFAERSLVALRDPDSGRVRVTDAVCPHRGAHLAFGGRLAGDALICPFHSYRIGLGTDSPDGFCVREYPTLLAAGGLFIRLSERSSPDFPAALEEMARGHRVVPGFELSITTSVEVVIENGFDSAHFRSVHRIMNLPSLSVRTGRFGELEGDGHFEIPRSGWYESPGASGNKLTTHYVAHAYSPGVFISELDGDPPFRYRIMTTATPADDDGRCTVRLTLLLPPIGDGHDERFAQELLGYSRDGLDKDGAIWSRLDLSHVPRYTARDDAARAFADFCRSFREDGRSSAP